MFLCLCLIILLGGCFNRNNDNARSAILHASGIKWSLQHKDQTDTERFATNLWIDKVKQKIYFTDSGKPISIAIIKSSFIDLPDKLEFKIKLLCKNPRTNVDFKIKVKGTADIDGTGSAVDVVTDEIAKQVVEKLQYEYGQINRPHLLPRNATVNYNGEMTDLINSNDQTKKVVIPTKVTGEQVDLVQTGPKVLEPQKPAQTEIKVVEKSAQNVSEPVKTAMVDLTQPAPDTSVNLTSASLTNNSNSPTTNTNNIASNVGSLASDSLNIANAAVNAGKRYENLLN